MIIAGNDEAKRSKIWRVVTLVSSVLIILIAVYLLTRMFTTNPVVGNWESEDATIALKIEKNDTIQVDITDIAENTDASIFGTAQRMISQPAFSRARIWATVASTSSVFVFVIDCILIGLPPPIVTFPI